MSDDSSDHELPDAGPTQDERGARAQPGMPPPGDALSPSPPASSVGFDRSSDDDVSPSLPVDANAPPAPVPAAVAAEKDKPPPVDRTTFLRWFNSSKLRGDLHDHVCRVYRLNEFDADDVLQLAYIKAEARSDWPALEEKMLPWLKTFAFFARLTFRRNEARRRKVVRPVAEPEGVHEVDDDPYETRAAEFHATAERMAAEDPKDAKSYAMLSQRFEGVPISAVAATFAMKEPAVYANTNRFAVRVGARMLERGAGYASAVAIAIAVICLILRSFLYKPPPVIALVPAPSESEPLPAMQTKPPVATLLRKQAQKAFEAKAYKPCLDLLDRARDLDPDGDQDPKIDQMRNDAQRALQKSPKGGG